MAKTLASQAKNGGSIPLARSTRRGRVTRSQARTRSPPSVVGGPVLAGPVTIHGGSGVVSPARYSGQPLTVKLT